MPIRIQLRRDTAANWALVNPILAQGEMGIEIDTDRAKLGNAVDAWNDLPYVFESGGVAASAGTEAISNGTLVFSNSNGISFGLNNSTLTASYTVPNQTQFILSNSNNVSFGTNGSTVTASASFSQSIQTQGSVLVNGSSGSIVFSNSNGFTFGNNNSTITASYTVPTVTNSSWSVSGGTSSETVSQLVFSNANGVSFGLGAGTITASHNGLTSQSNQAISGSNGSFTFQTASFGNSNGLSFYTTNGSLVGSYTVPIQTAQTGISSVALSDTTYTSGQISFRDGNGISWASTTGQGISVTHGLQYTSNTSAITGAALHTSASRVINIVAATNSTGGGTASLSSDISFSNANNFTFYTSAGNAIVASYSQSADTNKAGTGFTSAGNNIGLSGTLNTNGLSLSATAAAQTNQTLGVYGSSQTTGQSSSSTYDARSLTIRGAGIVSVGNSGGEFIISATGGGGGLTNINLSAGTTSNNLSAFTLSDGNGVSFGLNGSVVTATVQTNYLTTAAQSTQTNAFSLGGNTGTTNSSILSAGGYVIAGGSNITLSMSNNSLSIHAQSQSAQPQNLSLFALGNTTQNSSTALSANALSLNAIGSITVGYSNGSIQLSAPNALTTAMASNRGSDFVQATAAFNGTNASGTIASNAISISVLSQSNQTVGLYAIGNTTQNSSTTLDARTLSFNGLGIITAGYSNGSIQLSATQSNQAASASNGSFTFQTLNFSNANNVTWGTSAGGIITASVAAPGAAAENNWHHLLGANTAGNTTASGSTIGLSGINLTLSGTNGSAINISAPATSSLSATGQVSISTNGSTISIGVPGPYTYSGFNPYDDRIKVFTSIGQGSLMLDPQYFPNVQFDRLVLPLNNTNSSNSSGSHTLSFWLGIYTLNVSTLSLLASASSSTNITHSGTAGSYSLYSGMRLFTIPFTTTLTEGQYWLGFISRTTSGGTNGSYSFLGISQLASNFLGHFGSSHNTTYQYTKGQGIYNTTTSAMPASIGFNQIRGSDNGLFRFPALMFASSTV